MKILITTLLTIFTLSLHAQDSIPFQKTKSNLVVVTVKLNGIDANFLVDCGSEYTIVSSKFEYVYRYYKIEGSNKSITSGFDGDGNSTTEVMNAKIELLGTKIDTQIVELSSEDLLIAASHRTRSNIIGIIGVNDIKKLGLIIDFSKSILRR
jgi:predicted aspartyl protease